MGLSLLKAFVLFYFSGLSILAGFVGFKVLEGAVCEDGGCQGRGMAIVGDLVNALAGPELFVATSSVTVVIVIGTALFAVPWLIYAAWLKRTGRMPPV